MSKKSNIFIKTDNLKSVWKNFNRAFVFSTLSLATVMFSFNIPLIAITENVMQDIDVVLQKELSKVQNEIVFKSPISYDRATQYLIKNKPSSIDALLAYSPVEFKDSDFLLDIPFAFSLTKSFAENKNDFDKSKTGTLDMISQYSKNKNGYDKINIGENEITYEEAIWVSKLNSIVSDFKISRFSFQSSDDQIMKSLVNGQSDKKALKKVNITNKESAKEVDSSEIQLALSKPKTNEEKDQLINQINKTKEGIKQKEREAVVGIEQKKYKDQRIKEADIRELAKKKEIEQKIKEGKKSEITNDDIYALGKYSKELGLEITIPPVPEHLKAQIEADTKRAEVQDSKMNQFLQEPNKNLNNPEKPKELSWFDQAKKIVNAFFRFWGIR
jgi:hypothetical protein